MSAERPGPPRTANAGGLRTWIAPAELAGRRLDAALAALAPDLSRHRIARWIREGRARVDGRPARPALRLRGGERIELEVPAPEPETLEPEPIPLAIVHEDADLLVLDKPPGLVVHPAPGHARGTLVHALLHHRPEIAAVGPRGRPGLVHRLDKDTSGLLVVAKTPLAHRRLAEQLAARTMRRVYLALVRGSPGRESGTIDAPIGRSRADRKRFTTRGPAAPREARTHWEVRERLGECTLLEVRLDTGRTHQIRVHLAAAGMPVVGDPVYGGTRALGRRLGLERQALHAHRLELVHPRTGERHEFVSPLPPDMEGALARLRAGGREAGTP